MSMIAFREDLLDEIMMRERRFHERAYMFVLSALEYRQLQLTERRHLSGAELAHACRDLGLLQFGVMAKTVFEYWGIKSTADLGDVVFTLVDMGYLLSLPSDTRDQFADVFDFESAFDREYPWDCAVIA